NGVFYLPGLLPGTYRLAEVVKTGFTLTTPTEGFYDVTVSGSQAMSRTFGDQAIPTAPIDSIHGDVYQDNNGNGIEDKGEPYLAGITVYIDANNSGALDAGDTAVVSNNKGQYTFTAL